MTTRSNAIAALKGAVTFIAGWIVTVLVLFVTLRAASAGRLPSFRWLSRALWGNFGYSFSEQERSLTVVAQRLGYTCELIVASCFIALILAYALALLSENQRVGVVGRVLSSVADVFARFPVFWIALMLQFVFIVKQVPVFGSPLPSAGFAGSDHFDFGDRLRHIALPAFSLALFQIPILAECLRRSAHAPVRDRLNSPELLIGLVSAFCDLLPILVSADIVVETIYAWPGIGRLVIYGLVRGDLTLILATLLVCSFGLLAVRSISSSFHPVILDREYALPGIRALVRSWAFILPLALLLVIVAVALSAHSLTGGAANAIDNAHWQGDPMPPCFRNARTCAGHILGTDENGRDLLARIVIGARGTLGWSALSVVLEVVLGVGVGFAARKSGRFFTFGLLRLRDAVSSLAPLTLLLLISALTLARAPSAQQQPNMFAITIVVAALFWPRIARWSDAGNVLLQALKDWPAVILLLATVDFLGYGVFPPTASWGNMMANAESNMEIAWWAPVFPALCIFLAITLIDAIRNALSTPKLPQAPADS